MAETPPYMVIPPGNQLLFIKCTLALLALLLLAVLVEMVRRRAQRKRLVRAKWRRAEEIAKRKGVSGEDWELLRTLIQRQSPLAPLRAVVARQHFDACVEAELAKLEDRGDLEQYETAGARLRDLRTRLGLDFVPYGQRINSTRELTTGQPLWVAPGAGATTNWFRTRVVEVDEAHFAVTPWRSSDTPLPALEPDEDVRCHMWRDDDARYAFTTTVVRFEKVPPIWVFHHTAELQRTQSREYYRLHVDQATTVGVLDRRVTRDITKLHQQPVAAQFGGTITSLSGGGLALLVDETIAVQSVLRVKLKLPGEDPFRVHVRVVNSEPVPRQRHRIRASFLDADEDTCDRIAHYIMHRQQLLLASEEKAGEEPE